MCVAYEMRLSGNKIRNKIKSKMIMMIFNVDGIYSILWLAGGLVASDDGHYILMLMSNYIFFFKFNFY